jgi:hypothetical protein
LAVAAGNSGAEPDSDVGGRPQLGDEAAGHADGQRLAPYGQRDPGRRIWPGAGRPDRLSLPRQRRTPVLRPWRGLRRPAAPGPVARGRSCGRARRACQRGPAMQHRSQSPAHRTRRLVTAAIIAP